MKTRILTLATLLTLLVLTSALASADRLRIRLTNIHCVNAQEDGWFSDGDEPYVLTSTISRGGLLGRRLQFNETPTYDDMDAGDDRNPGTTLYLDNMNNGSVVVVAQLIEHDDSERDLIEDLVRSASQVDFTNAVTNGTNDYWTLGGIVADAMEGGVDAAALPFVDDDERIGAPTPFIVSQATFDGLALNQFVTLTRQVSGNGATYNLTFEIRRVL